MEANPYLQALFIADDAEQDSSGKVTLHGIFQKITVTAAGAEYDKPCCAFFALRGLHEDVALQLTYTDLETGEVLVEMEVYLRDEGPLQTVGRAVELPGMPVPHEGDYVWDLYCRNDLVGSVRIVAEIEQTEG